jgi:hypothetical protein
MKAVMKPATSRRPQPLPAGKSLSGPALRAFFRIATLWRLDTGQERTLLGNPPPSTYFKWKKDPQAANVSRDVLERISYVLGIFKALQILFPEPARADAWLTRPNDAPLFRGQSALARMLGGNVSDLFVVRQYLDAQRGG